MTHPSRAPLRLYLLALLLTSYGFVLLYFLLGGEWRMPGALIVAITYMFLPLLVTLLFLRFVLRAPVASSLGISLRVNRWWIAAWLLPPVYALLTFLVSIALPGIRFDPQMSGMVARFGQSLPPDQLAQLQAQIAAAPFLPAVLGLGGGLLAGVTINAVAAFGEEAAWRGFLLRKFLPVGFWRASFVIGLIWGIWHAPIILLGHNYPQHPVAGVFLMTVWTILLTPIMNYVTLRAKSVLAAAVFHGTLNGTLGLSLLYVSGGSDLTVGATGLAGMLALLLMDAALWRLMKRKNLRLALP